MIIVAIKKRDKRGVSAIVGYVLLIVFAISISVVVFNFLRKSIPKEEEKCPDAVSIEIRDYTSASGLLKLEIKNRGLFSINGLTFTLKQEEKVCKISKIECPKCARSMAPYNKILFKEELKPDVSAANMTVKYSGCAAATSVEITPMKYMEEGFSSCEMSIIRENID